MSIPKFELDKKTPLDTKTAIGYFGSEESYFRLMEQYEQISLLSDLQGWAKAVEEKDYHEVKERIHSIKGASAYAGASRVTDHCYWMQYYYMEGENQKMMDLYPKLIESVVEYRVFHRKVLAERKGQTYIINPEHETCPVAKGYRIIKEADYKYRWEKIDQEEDNEEIEQLDKDSVKDVVQEAEQPNEQEYLRSQNEEKKKTEEAKAPLSNNQFQDIETSKPVVIDQADVSKAKKKVGRKTDGPGQDDFDDNVHIDLELEKRGKQAEVAAAKQEKIHTQQHCDVNYTNPSQQTNNMINNKNNSSSRKMNRNDNQGSHPVLTIEMEEADKGGGMCSCSKCVIF